MAWSNQTKDSSTFNNLDKSDEGFWGDAFVTWGDAAFDWGQNTTTWSDGTKDSSTFTNQVKH